MLLVSLVLHGVVLLFPASEHDAAEQEAADANNAVTIDVTSLPKRPAPPGSEPPTEPVPPPAETPEAAPAVTPAPPIQPPARQAPPPQPSPPAAAPQTSVSEPDSEPADEEETVNPPTSPAEPNPSQAAPPTTTPFPFSDFPHLQAAQPGCFGLSNCHQVEGGNFRQESVTLVEQLTADGYDVQPRDDLEDSGLKVFEVTKGGVTEYLSLLQPELSQTVYVLAPEPVDVAKLQAAAALEDQFHDILRQLSDGTQARYSDFTYPDFFFSGTAPRPELSDLPYTVLDTQPERLTNTLLNQLAAAGFTAEQLGDYAGAPLYEVSQDAFVAYLSVVPAQRDTGTVLLAWNQLPEPPL